MMSVTWPAGIPDLYEHPREQADFERRLHIGEKIKEEMRRGYAFASRQKRGTRSTFDDMLRRATDFWSGYEEINRFWVPEDPVYSKVCTGITGVVANSFWEIKAPAAGQVRVLESFFGGENTASTVARIQIHRITSTGTGTAPTVYVPELFNTRSPAAASVVWGGLAANVVWGTAQATFAANPLVLHGFNSFGGSDRWVAQPGEEIYLVNAEILGCRPFVTTPIVSAYLVFEEL
jgi:hypothetical protein